MKIRTWIKYEESFLPTPRCRKLRYRECEDYVEANLKEVDKGELKLAFEDDSYGGAGEIYFYKGKLWMKDKTNAGIISDLQERGKKVSTALEYLIYCHENCSTYFFFSWDREQGKDTSRDAVIKKLRADMSNYILVDGELYRTTAEPRYCIYTFGLGHNHGGTSLSVDYHYNINIGKERYFSALDGEKAVEEANRIAARRGDTNYVGKFVARITVHMPELVKIKPKKQHGNGNEIINSMESIINHSNSANEAGLMCMIASAMVGR